MGEDLVHVGPDLHGRLPVLDDEERLVGVVTLSSMAFRAPDKDEALETAQQVSKRSARRSA